MEEENHLAEEYVQEFVLDHLEDVVVKSENRDRSDPNNNTDEDREVPSTPVVTKLSALGRHISMPPQVSPATPHAQLLTPPTHSGDEQPFSHEGGPLAMHHHHHPAVMRLAYVGSPARPDMMGYHPGTPGTPPDTPPVTDSPESPPMIDYVNPHLMSVPKPEMIDGSWVPHPPKLLRQEPLDLRPHCASDTMDWSIGQNHPSVIAGSKRMAPYHPSYDYDEMVVCGKRMRAPSDYQDMDSMSPGTPGPMIMGKSGMCMGPRFDALSLGDPESVLDDETLTTLTVRDLNKKLHGFPREVVAKLKQKRRTLKNRGYAQNCRSKRIQQKHDLEATNNTLRREIERLTNELQLARMELHRMGKRDLKELYQQHQELQQHRCDQGDDVLRRGGHEGQEWSL